MSLGAAFAFAELVARGADPGGVTFENDLVNSHSNTLDLSAVVVAQDEAANLPACLASLSFCDEVLVVDEVVADAAGHQARTVPAHAVLVDTTTTTVPNTAVPTTAAPDQGPPAAASG